MVGVLKTLLKSLPKVFTDYLRTYNNKTARLTGSRSARDHGRGLVLNSHVKRGNLLCETCALVEYWHMWASYGIFLSYMRS